MKAIQSAYTITTIYHDLYKCYIDIINDDNEIMLHISQLSRYRTYTHLYDTSFTTYTLTVISELEAGKILKDNNSTSHVSMPAVISAISAPIALYFLHPSLEAL